MSGHDGKRGTIHGVTTRLEPTVEPERGLVLAVLPRSADAEEELGELRELATAGVEPVAQLVQQRASPDRARMSARESSTS